MSVNLYENGILTPVAGKGIEGDKGDIGKTPNITITAEIDNTIEIPNVEVSKAGDDENPLFNFSFSGIKGSKGDKGDKGNTPERGVDYWTDADKNIIINTCIDAVLDRLPTAESVEV